MIHRRQVELFDRDGKSLGAWNSVLEAEARTGYSHTVIKNCAGCLERGACKMCAYFRKYGVTWRYTG